MRPNVIPLTPMAHDVLIRGSESHSTSRPKSPSSGWARLGDARRDVQRVKELISHIGGSPNCAGARAWELLCSAVEDSEGVAIFEPKDQDAGDVELEDAPLSFRLRQLQHKLAAEGTGEHLTHAMLLKELHGIKRDLIRIACEAAVSSANNTVLYLSKLSKTAPTKQSSSQSALASKAFVSEEEHTTRQQLPDINTHAHPESRTVGGTPTVTRVALPDWDDTSGSQITGCASRRQPKSESGGASSPAMTGSSSDMTFRAGVNLHPSPILVPSTGPGPDPVSPSPTSIFDLDQSSGSGGSSSSGEASSSNSSVDYGQMRGTNPEAVASASDTPSFRPSELLLHDSPTAQSPPHSAFDGRDRLRTAARSGSPGRCQSFMNPLSDNHEAEGSSWEVAASESSVNCVSRQSRFQLQDNPAAHSPSHGDLNGHMFCRAVQYGSSGREWSFSNPISEDLEAMDSSLESSAGWSHPLSLACTPTSSIEDRLREMRAKAATEERRAIFESFPERGSPRADASHVAAEDGCDRQRYGDNYSIFSVPSPRAVTTESASLSGSAYAPCMVTPVGTQPVREGGTDDMFCNPVRPLSVNSSCGSVWSYNNPLAEASQEFLSVETNSCASLSTAAHPLGRESPCWDGEEITPSHPTQSTRAAGGSGPTAHPLLASCSWSSVDREPLTEYTNPLAHGGLAEHPLEADAVSIDSRHGHCSPSKTFVNPLANENECRSMGNSGPHSDGPLLFDSTTELSRVRSVLSAFARGHPRILEALNGGKQSRLEMAGDAMRWLAETGGQPIERLAQDSGLKLLETNPNKEEEQGLPVALDLVLLLHRLAVPSDVKCHACGSRVSAL